MFEATRLVFYYAVTPVHMGAGSAIGAIDNPIQREVHTQHPMFAGSGIKGALRHHFTRSWKNDSGKQMVTRIFGPDTNASDYAGALSLSDAQLVVLPVRSLKGAYVYATCPLALARAKRLALLAGIPVEWPIPTVKQGHAIVAEGTTVLSDKRLILEAFDFAAIKDEKDDPVAPVAEWLAKNALPHKAPQNEGNGEDEHEFFRVKLQNDLVVLSDTEFAHFARHAMVVEPHVRIDEATGTADDGGLFYTENLPPESILVGLAQASVERFKKDSRNDSSPELLKADDVLHHVFSGPDDRAGIAGKLLQIGGDATTGRGLVVVNSLSGSDARNSSASPEEIKGD